MATTSIAETPGHQTPRVPPRVRQVPPRDATLHLGRSTIARVQARILALDPTVTPEEARAALIDAACSKGSARGIKEASLEHGWLTPEQATNVTRSARRREVRRAAR